MDFKPYHEIITESWKFFKRHAENFTSWDDVVKEAEDFRKKYGGEFARSELMSKIYELERIIK